MAYKICDDVWAAAAIVSDGVEWPWRVEAGTKGTVKAVRKDGQVEVHFECGVVRLCKDVELKGKK